MIGTIMNRTRVLTLVAVAGIYAGISGCATTGDLDALKSQVNAAAADAKSAKAEAAAASREAAEAKSMAQDAMATANEAKATSAETETKIDRMFKKAMYK
jgi:murein lipoprotein